MRAQHVQVLDVQGPAAAGEEVIYLLVVVEQEHAFLSDFFAGEVMGL